MPTAKPRLHHFDVLKGIAIFMVVMGHVITFCIRELDRATLFKFIGEIHMPLFFFISGWFTFGLKADGTLKLPKIGARARQLLIPMVVVSSLWIFYFPHSGLESPLQSTFGALWTATFKNGYWFTLCLFEIILVYALLTPMLNRTSRAASGIAVTAVVWVALIMLWYVTRQSDICGILSLELLATYWPAFMMGVIASRHRKGFESLTTSSCATTVAMLAGGLMLYYISWYWEFPYGESFEEFAVNIAVARAILHICLAIIAIAVIAPWTTRAYADLGPQQKPGIWIRTWTYLGVNSLGIYLLHYFFLFPLGSWRQAMDAMNVGFAPLFVVAALWAAVIIVLVLGLLRIISVSAPINFLLTGTLPPRKK